jgi:methyl-accepting chemotaxis protein
MLNPTNWTIAKKISGLCCLLVALSLVIADNSSQLAGAASSGIGQISVALQAIERTTQETAAAAEESASASAELNAQANSMRGIVNTLEALL